MVGADDGADLFLGQRLVVQLTFVVPGKEPGDEDVQLALRQAFHQHVAALHQHRDAQQGALLQGALDGFGNQRDRRPLDRAHAHGDGVAFLQRFDLVAGFPEAGQRDARMADHHLAVQGGAHAARHAFEQRHLHQVFEVLEQFRCRRLRHVQRLGRAVDIALLIDGDQQQQLPRLQSRAQKPRFFLGHSGHSCAKNNIRV